MAGGAPFQLTIDGTDYLGAFAGGSATTPYVIPDTVELSADGDGGGSQFAFEVQQEVTPAPGGTATPWYASLPDNAVVKFIDTSNGTATLFTGFVGSIEALLNGGGQGTTARVSCLSSSALLDRIMVWKGLPSGSLGGIANATISTIMIARGTYDDVAIKAILDNYVTGRLGAGISDLFDPTVQTGITRTALLNPDAADGNIEIPLGNLRAALDTILELAQATDGKERRYYVDGPSKRLVYGWASAADAGVTYATAPFKVITTGVDEPAGGTATASTLLVRDLSVGLDHDSARKRAFILTADSNADDDTDPDPYVRLYTDVGFSVRPGLVTDSLVGAPTVRGSDRTAKLDNAATAYFAMRRAPQQTIRFAVRGAGTATGQLYGYATGTAQSSGTAFAAINNWAPGQFVDIDAPGLGVDGLYRVEEVTMRFEQGSLIRAWDITCAKRPRGLASQYLIGR